MTHFRSLAELISPCAIYIPFAIVQNRQDDHLFSTPAMTNYQGGMNSDSMPRVTRISEFQSLTNLHLQKLIIICRHGHRTGRIRLNIEDATGEPIQWNCPSLFHEEIDQDDSQQHNIMSAYESFYESTHLNGNCLRGQLTASGALQCKTLGSWMNQYYEPFLNAHVRELDDIYCRASDVVTRRTEESLKYFLGGFLGDKHPLKKCRIPIALREATLENLYPNFTRCRRLSKIIAQKSDLRWVEREAKKYGVWNLIERINTSETLNPLFPLSVLNTLRSYTDIGLELPSHILEEEAQQLEEFCSAYSHHLFDDEVGLQLSIGRFLNELLENMESSTHLFHQQQASALNSATRARCNVILAHDTTILPLITAFTHQPYLHPNFASNLVFELYTEKGDTSKRYIRILYDGSPLCIPQLDDDELAQGLCVYRFEDFKKHAAPYALTNTEYFEMCRYEPGSI
mmetsp:Transcript_5356/g.20008  ORF Transcript_5356/g.20008 Transcript_5356/m.20008 type:complete len:457 (-) Transcript_5356:715-2085(-)